MYRILFTKQAQRALSRLPQDKVVAIIRNLESVAQNPYAHRTNATKLQNRSGYRLRIGDWRVIYEIQDNELVILVLKIAPRGEVYR